MKSHWHNLNSVCDVQVSWLQRLYSHWWSFVSLSSSVSAIPALAISSTSVHTTMRWATSACLCLCLCCHLFVTLHTKPSYCLALLQVKEEDEDAVEGVEENTTVLHLFHNKSTAKIEIRCNYERPDYKGPHYQKSIFFLHLCCIKRLTLSKLTCIRAVFVI